jgi:hypothetical protein
MNTFIRFGSVGAIALAAAVAGADTVIYSSTRSVSNQGLTLKGWGSGSAAETDEIAYEGTTSIRVSSRNFFQGGILNYSTAIDLTADSSSPNSLLVVRLKAPGLGTTLGGGGARAGGGGRGGVGGPPAGGGGLGGLGGGAAGGGAQRGGPGGNQEEGAQRTTPSGPFDILRLVIKTEDGLRSEAFLDVPAAQASTDGWRTVGIPLQAINGFDRTNKKVTSISFSTDAVASVYLGDVRVLDDSTPIFGEPNQREYNLALGDEIVLGGSGYGGATPLRYTWDFDASDGISIDSEGQSVKRKFRVPGEYTVTFTIRDQYDVKKAHSSTIKVVVNP